MTETKVPNQLAEGVNTTPRRRSQRLQIAMPVVLRASKGGAALEEATKTIRVNAHGCSLSLTAELEPGQKACLLNPVTREEVTCTVNFVGKREGEHIEIGLEFNQPSPLFWRIYFPPADWNPDDRKLPDAVAPLASSTPRR